MNIFWCYTGPWLAAPAATERFCARAGIPTEDFFRREDLVPHAAGRYLLLQGFRLLRPDQPLPALAEGPSGKPYFSGDGPAFSLSHTGGLAVCAFASSALGVDVEEIGPVDPLLLPALHPEERAGLQRLPEADRAAAFFRLWTRKESLLKARGGVLADIFEQESLLTPEGRWRERAGDLLLRDIPLPDPACAASVCTREAGPMALVQLTLPADPRHLESW